MRLLHRVRKFFQPAEPEILFGWWYTGETYKTGSGQVLVNVHRESDECQAYNCVVHNPSERALAIGYTHWRKDRQIMERICKHGVGHPDPDAMAHLRRMDEDMWSDLYPAPGALPPIETRGIHGCDGCCRP